MLAEILLGPSEIEVRSPGDVLGGVVRVSRRPGLLGLAARLFSGRRRPCLSSRFIAVLFGIALAACAQQEGEVCERFPDRGSDCAEGPDLLWLRAVTFRDGCRPVTVRRGICSATCVDDPDDGPAGGLRQRGDRRWRDRCGSLRRVG